MARGSFEKGAIDDFWRARRCFSRGASRDAGHFGDPQNYFFSSPRGMHLACFTALRHMGKGRG